MRFVAQDAVLLWITPNAAQVIERAGRVCYKSEDKITADSAARFIEMVMKRGHESVIEHASASFHITCDRGVSHEIVRHRIASYSQESTRYCNYGKKGEIAVVEPPGLSPDGRVDWHRACEDAEQAYLALLDGGASPQIARSVLPTCLKTEIVMTANFREWRHFLRLRTAPEAHPSMREVAGLIRAVLTKQCAEVFVL